MKRLSGFSVLGFARKYKLFSLTLLVAIISLVLRSLDQQTAANWLLAATALIVALPLVRDMYQDIRHGTYGIDLLAITAIVSAVILKEYWTAIVIVLMLTGGGALEDYAENRSRRELDALLNRAPQKAHIVRGRKVVDIAASAVRTGDTILIKPGEVVPVDAEIIDGTASFDESSLTGESLPESKTVGDDILSGSINLDGAIRARAVHIAADSQYQQIVKLVTSAANSQAPFVRLADRYSIPFTIIAFAIAGGVWIASGDPVRFLQVIVVATPCPLLLAAPIAIISGMSRASKQGIIVRTGSALERLAKVQTVAFDKTGTLTTGKPVIADIMTFGNYDQSTVLSMAAALESSSGHVLAHAINEAALERAVKVPKARNINEFAGKGMAAMVAGKQILVGRKSLLDEQNIPMPPKFRAASIKQTATYVAIGGELAGAITFVDEIRPEAEATLARLQKLGVKQFEMVTGDNKAVAAAVASQLGITQVTSEALPADKLLAVEAMRYRPVAFVGDGVNDAPVLTASDVGIALGARGSTAASESADMIIMVDDISRVATGVAIANRTFKIARQSILVGIGLSVMLMIIFATGKFPPIYGAAIQELVDIVVIFNALRAHTGGSGDQD
ncbi:MAG TPA: heavy metal translocating P-type ATPase [Candidatus Saccharimonadales bacterium]|jgi:heavy metal translocating P-type ATPase